MNPVLIGIILFVALFVGSAFYVAHRQAKANASAGVVVAWEGLRVTKTELIEGYGAAARRHPLAGLARLPGVIR